MKLTEIPKQKWLIWISLSILGLGILSFLITVIAPLGYRVNLWGYRTGFTILRTMVPIWAYVAGTAAILTVTIGILAREWEMENLSKWIGMGAAGTVITLLTWYVPQTYLAPGDAPYPSIHDISTDTVNPPEFLAVLPLRADADNGVEYGVSRDMDPRLLAQLTREAYPDLLEPVILDVSPDTAFDSAMNAVNQLGWEVVDANKEAGRIEATDQTFWFGFKDDVVIRLTPRSSGIKVDARSVSRVGKGDVGINAKRLRRFLDLL
jgi:uncharacterized protein (DUF1499 family)